MGRLFSELQMAWRQGAAIELGHASEESNMPRENRDSERSGSMGGGGWPAMNPWLEQARQFTEMWTEMASKVASASTAYEPGASPPDAARQVRGAMFRTMSQFAEELMRWPQFLTAMRQSMDTAATMQKQFNDLMTSMRHNTQGVARDDIDSVLQSIEHLETRLLDRLEDLSDRLDDLSRRLAAVGGNGKVHAADEEDESETGDRSDHVAGRRSSRRPRSEVSRDEISED
jgi:Mg2+ and Co2+ transporter CorA